MKTALLLVVAGLLSGDINAAKGKKRKSSWAASRDWKDGDPSPYGGNRVMEVKAVKAVKAAERTVKRWRLHVGVTMEVVVVR